MGKNKLKKFREMETLECVFQYPFGVLREKGFPLRGRWHEDYFRNDGPIVLELGCGKGEYTVGLARRYPGKNFIGIDIKGARMWTGACQARDGQLTNVAFVRTNIELLSHFFCPRRSQRNLDYLPRPADEKGAQAPDFYNLPRPIPEGAEGRGDGEIENRQPVPIHIYQAVDGVEQHPDRNQHRRPLSQRCR